MTFQWIRTCARQLATIACLSAGSLLCLLGCAVTPPPASASNSGLQCSALPDAAQSPLPANTEVSVLTTEDLPGVPDEWEPNRVTGVRLRMAAPPGWSRAFLERRVFCYRSVASRDSEVKVLGVDGSSISVREARARFEIDVTSEEPEIVRRILESMPRSSESGAASTRSAQPSQHLALRD